MRYWYIGAAALVLAAVAGVLLLREKSSPNPEIDGGVRHYEDTDAPKVIQSAEIVSFHCKFSTTDIPLEDSPIAGRIMTLHAEGEEGYYRHRNRSEEGQFCPDEAFFRQLQQIVSRYDFAQYNGKHYSVSGLPPDYGVRLEIRYASGESICASNNQSCFIPLAALEELAALFQQQESGGS